jgi:transposase-like protein
VNAIEELPIIPEVEVSAKAKRRRFKAQYKLEVLQKADACTQVGEVGALLRAEGLYSSHLTTWRQARERGELAGLAPKTRGPKPVPSNPLEKKVVEMERQLARATARAERAEALVEIQKKVAALLGVPFESEKSS